MAPHGGSDEPSAAWHTYRLFGLSLASDVPFVTPLPPTQCPSDLSYTCQPEPPGGPHWTEQTPERSVPLLTPDGRAALSVSRSSAGHMLRFGPIADFYLCSRHIVCHLRQPTRAALAETYLLGQVLAFWQESRGITVLHASSVVVAGQAIAFLGYGLSGKSSLAASFLQAGHPLLSDDNLHLHLAEGKVTAQPGYPQMRLWDEPAHHFLGSCQGLAPVHDTYPKRRVVVGEGGLGTFCSQECPLAALYLLQRSDRLDVEITRLTPARALFALACQSFTAGYIKALANEGQRLRRLAQLVRSVPVFRLEYPSGLAHLPAVREAVTAQLAC